MTARRSRRSCWPGTVEDESVAYRPAWWYEEKQVELLLGARAVGARRPRPRTVDARLRRRAALREAADRDRRARRGGCPSSRATRTSTLCAPSPTPAGCARSWCPGARLAIVGAGFIGQEVAATARRLGVEVTMIEALETPLAPILGERGRVAGSPTCTSSEGVRVMTGAMLEGARGNGAGQRS